MIKSKRLLLIGITILCCFIQVNGVDQYTDEKRPYEFGFTIDGQQHRHEKKDKNGIIMGEFGFITADDVYHVTVYATDENGRFKILSMKNIHLKATPDTRQGHSLQFPPAAPTPTSNLPRPALPASGPVLSTPKPREEFKPVAIAPPVNSCSHCSVPTTSTQAPKAQPASNTFNENNNKQSPPGSFGSLGSPNSPRLPSLLSSTSLSGSPIGSPIYAQNDKPNIPPVQQSAFGVLQNVGSYNPSNTIGQSDVPSESSAIDQSPPSQDNYINPQNRITNYPQQGSALQNANRGPNVPEQSLGNINSYQGQQNINNYPQSSLPTANIPPYSSQDNTENYSPPVGSLVPPIGEDEAGPTSSTGSRTAKQFGDQNKPPVGFSQANAAQSGANFGVPQGAQAVPNKPTLVSAQMQIVDKNTDIYKKRPGEKNGLPTGLTENDMMRLLYTFNYTLGFQAHYEEGYSNGFKQGYYFVTGRNGVRTRVDYTADDTGFHPKISQEILDLLSDDVPKPETEKEAKYGLKGYEFKWLYYPVDHKSR